MTVTLKFKLEVEAGLLTQAQASGMTVEDTSFRWWKGRCYLP